MYGLEAISANNGWAMAAVGITIVFTGLVLLSFLISQLHKVLDLWENKDQILQKRKDEKKKKAEEEAERAAFSKLEFSADFKEIARVFNLLVGTLEGAFSLQELLDLAKKRGLTKPHSSLNSMVEDGLIAPVGDGYYTWNEKLYNSIIEKG